MRTHSIEILDDQGRVRITLDGGDAKSAPQIKFRDPSGQEVLVLAGNPGTPGVTLVDAKGVDRVTLLATDDLATLTIRDGAGSDRVQVADSPRHTGVVVVNNGKMGSAPAGIVIESPTGHAELGADGWKVVPSPSPRPE